MKTKHLIILLAANFLFVGASITAFAKDKAKVTDASDSKITYIGRSECFFRLVGSTVQTAFQRNRYLAQMFRHKSQLLQCLD